MLHDPGVPMLWPVIAIGGAILGWLIGAGLDAVREYLRDRKAVARPFEVTRSWRQRLDQRGGKIAAWIVVVGIGGAIEYRLVSFQLFGDQVTDKSVIERNGGFQLSPAVREVQAAIQGGPDPVFRARLVVRPVDLPAFLQSAAVHQPKISGPVSDEFKHKPFDHFTNRWWTPRLPPALYEAGEETWIYRDDEGETWNRKQFMLIDETNPNQFIIWIVAFAE